MNTICVFIYIILRHVDTKLKKNGNTPKEKSKENNKSYIRCI